MNLSKLLQILSLGTSLSEHDVLRIARNAPVRYKTYPIEKRKGERESFHSLRASLKLYRES